MHFSTFHPIFHKTFQPFSFIIAHVSIDSLLVRFTICHILTINTACFVLFSLLVLSKLSSQLRPLFNWFVYINNSWFYLYLPLFMKIAFLFNCRWSNLPYILCRVQSDSEFPNINNFLGFTMLLWALFSPF